MSEVVEGREQAEPYAIVSEPTDAPNSDPQAFLVTDRELITEVPLTDIPMVLTSAYFTYNICYPKGCTNFYAFMEVVPLNFPAYKALPTVKHLLSSLKAHV